MVAAAVALAFAAGGALLAADAWQKAWRPTLRVVFEELARIERARAAAERRVLPEDDEAFAIVEGVLRSDASRASAGVSLSVAVDGISRPGPDISRPGPLDRRRAQTRHRYSRVAGC